MRLLFDQNLSRSLVRRLSDRFRDSTHVTQVSLEGVTDNAIWAWARTHSHAVVTKDRDFESAADFPGPPPKCILVILGNANTDDIEALLRRSVAEIDAFEHDERRLLTLP